MCSLLWPPGKTTVRREGRTKPVYNGIIHAAPSSLPQENTLRSIQKIQSRRHDTYKSRICTMPTLGYPIQPNLPHPTNQPTDRPTIHAYRLPSYAMLVSSKKETRHQRRVSKPNVATATAIVDSNSGSASDALTEPLQYDYNTKELKRKKPYGKVKRFIDANRKTNQKKMEKGNRVSKSRSMLSRNYFPTGSSPSV
jgi:hypothetical protein